jgi:hypothetical protein
MTTNERSEFAQFIDQPKRPEITPPANLKLLPAGRFLNWLLNNWDADTISAYEIYTYGPRPIKNLKEAMSVAEILVQRGWLVPVRAHRHDRKLWRVIRENEQMEIPRTGKTADDHRRESFTRPV